MNTIEQSIKALEKWRKKDMRNREWDLYSANLDGRQVEVFAYAHRDLITGSASTPRAALDKLCRRLSLP